MTAAAAAEMPKPEFYVIPTDVWEKMNNALNQFQNVLDTILDKVLESEESKKNPLMSSKELLEFTKISPTTLERMITAGNIQVFRLLENVTGSKRLFLRAEIEKMVREGKI